MADPLLQDSLHSASPLETLVRRTSSRRKPVIRLAGGAPSSAADRDWSKRVEPLAPPSPLLHTRFRSSVATHASVTPSFDLASNRFSGERDGQDIIYYNDDASVYSHNSPASTRTFDISGITNGFTFPTDDRFRETSGQFQPPYSQRDSDNIIPLSPASNYSGSSSIPQVVISEAPSGLEQQPAPFQPSSAPPTREGRAPSFQSGAINYSRPNRPGLSGTEEAKRQVLERNSHRKASPLSAQHPYPPSWFPSHTKSSDPRSPDSQRQLDHNVSSPMSSRLTHSSPTSPPPSSPYSEYSFYQFDSAVPSPTSDTLRVPGASSSPVILPRSYSTPNLTTGPPANEPKAPSDSPSSAHPLSADDYLQLGIQHHEANRLSESATCFEKSAQLSKNEKDSSGVGMLMWGLTLRHGWGCPKNERAGFTWLSRAAEAAVGDLEKARIGVSTSAVKGELILAIYEVGQCFFQGWGVKKDQKMGVNYFRVAANLGDMDAQQELAFCLANGRGCKKDRKEAAKWYREAVSQGASDVGLAWIYKEKFL